MAETADSEYQGAGDAGASSTYPMQAGSVKKNAYCILKGRPCKVVDIATSKTGKHGHAKARFTGIDIFTGNKLEDMCPTSHNMDIPIVNRVEYQLVDITGEGFVSLMTSEGVTKEDMRLPTGDLGEQVKEMFEEGKPVIISVISAMGEEKIVAAKENREE